MIDDTIKDSRIKDQSMKNQGMKNQDVMNEDMMHEDMMHEDMKNHDNKNQDMKNQDMNDYNMNELLQVLAARVRKYTSNESTSVSYDKAKQLMSSILYCMEEAKIYEPGKQDSMLIARNSKQDANQVFILGLSKKKELINQAKALFKEISKSFYSYKNICYEETVIKGMPAFFERYDVEFDATNHMLTLDYPLLVEVNNLTGIDLIYEYLRRIRIEQLFLNKFPIKQVIKILYGYHAEYSEHIFNISKLVLRNAIGSVLLGKSIGELIITDQDQERLMQISKNASKTDLENLLCTALDKMISMEFENNQILHDYLKCDLNEFAFQYYTYSVNNCLNKLFLNELSEDIHPKTIFVDGISIDDEALRTLIEEMNIMRYVSDKLILLKKQVQSLSDLKELLKESFFKDEYVAVFSLLSDEELKVLKSEITIKMEFETDLEEWEVALMNFTT